MGDRLELVVDEQLRSHCDETLGPGEKKKKKRRERREGKKERRKVRGKGRGGRIAKGEGKEGEKYEHKRLQSCLVELPTSSIYYSSQLSTHSLKKTVKSCETNIDSITYSDLQHKLEI